MEDYLKDVRAKIAAERARRPKGWAQRCERCWFWQHDDGLDSDSSYDEDRAGECHRNAPQIVHHHMAEGIGLIAWAVETLAKIEHNEFFDYSFETVETRWADWPRMAGHDWCGEFLERGVEVR